MSFVLERSLKLDDVLLVLRVRRVELLEDSDLGEAAFPQRVVVPHDLDGDRRLSLGVYRPGYAGEHAPTQSTRNLVPAIQHLTRSDLVVAVLVVTLQDAATTTASGRPKSTVLCGLGRFGGRGGEVLLVEVICKHVEAVVIVVLVLLWGQCFRLRGSVCQRGTTVLSGRRYAGDMHLLSAFILLHVYRGVVVGGRWAVVVFVCLGLGVDVHEIGVVSKVERGWGCRGADSSQRRPAR